MNRYKYLDGRARGALRGAVTVIATGNTIIPLGNKLVFVIGPVDCVWSALQDPARTVQFLY